MLYGDDLILVLWHHWCCPAVLDNDRQIGLDFGSHWAVKFPLTLAVALSLLLISYHDFVRPTFIRQVSLELR
jgi:hypothetical protein